MSQLKEDLFRKLVRELIKQELDEANSTASVGGQYNTPHTFAGSNKKGKKKGKAGYEGGHTEPTDGTGHFIADDPKLRKESVNEGSISPAQAGKLFDKLLKKQTKGNLPSPKDIETVFSLMRVRYGIKSESINEGKYHDYRNDESMTPRQKIGMAMRETRDSLKELESIVKNNVRLKTELNVDSRSYWKNTHKALSKISERLVNLANKVGQLH